MCLAQKQAWHRQGDMYGGYGLLQGGKYGRGAGTARVGVGQGSLHISLRLAVCMATRSLQSYESVHVNTSNSS